MPVSGMLVQMVITRHGEDVAVVVDISDYRTAAVGGSVQSRKGPTSRPAARPSDGPGRRNPVRPLADKGDIRLWRRRRRRSKCGDRARQRGLGES